MKSNTFLVVVIGLQLVLVVAHIYKENVYIQASYQQQRLERQREELRVTAQKLTQQLQALQNRSTITSYARQQLHMQPVPLKSVRRLHANQPTQS